MAMKDDDGEEDEEIKTIEGINKKSILQDWSLASINSKGIELKLDFKEPLEVS